MKLKRSKAVLQELIWGIMIAVVCLALLAVAVKNQRSIQMESAYLPYAVQGYPQGKILLIGSSFMEYWKTSAADLGPLDTVNVGVASTKVEDWEAYFSKLIEPFHPEAIIMYVGSNDIDGSKNSKSGKETAQELEILFDRIEMELPDTPVYYISIAPTLKRWNVWEESSTCNELVRKMAQERDLLNFIDCTSVLLDEEGIPKAEIFRSDSLHFNEEGYKLWKSVIRPVLLVDLESEEEVE